jgi:hypothetical protein
LAAPIPHRIAQDSPDWKGVDAIQPETIGLGDRIEKIAQPIARVIDKIAGTNIQGCGACQKRKEYLNSKFI